MEASRPLSKTEFVRGLDCVRRPWLDRNRPDLKAEISAATQELFDAGREIGELARQRYQDGLFVRNPGSTLEEAAEETQRLIAEGATCLFEATFIADGRSCRVDVLTKSDEGWTIDEVKASTKKAPEDLDEDKVLDLAYQTWVLKSSGLPLHAARLVLVDRDYRWPGGEYPPGQMLDAVDLTNQCVVHEALVEATSARLIEALAQPEQPDVEINTHCKTCDFFDHCCAGRSKNDVIFLPRISRKAVTDFRARGIHCVQDLPDDSKLTDARRRIRNVVLSKQPYVSPGLADALCKVAYPAAFIDYETTGGVFPLYLGTRPYQSVCFQWSAHLIKSSEAKPTHKEFLAADNRDPREDFCRTLWKAVETCPSIVHYTGFEITRLREMARDSIPFADRLLDAIEERSVDLEAIVREHVYYEDFRGRTSIKVVLPALVAGMSYQNLAIADGQMASAEFRRMLNPDTQPDDAAQIRINLLEYCKQDTLAMVEIYRSLNQLAGSSSKPSLFL